MAELSLKEIAQKMAENDQWSPLFADEPDASDVLRTNVSGKVLSFKLDNGRKVYSLQVKDDKATYTFNISGDHKKDTFNIGQFVALRDYKSTRGTVYVGGETKRIFAY